MSTKCYVEWRGLLTTRWHRYPKRGHLSQKAAIEMVGTLRKNGTLARAVSLPKK